MDHKTHVRAARGDAIAAEWKRIAPPVTVDENASPVMISNALVRTYLLGGHGDPEDPVRTLSDMIADVAYSLRERGMSFEHLLGSVESDWNPDSSTPADPDDETRSQRGVVESLMQLMRDQEMPTETIFRNARRVLDDDLGRERPGINI